MIRAKRSRGVVHLSLKDRKQLTLMAKHWRMCLFVGITSVIGSIGWFTAASFENAAYVKALGQVEFFITLLLTYRIFKERISRIEYLGMLLIIVSVVILLLWA
ncbi:EamA family transporter [Colwellia sp. PAMC 20917]|uniref:EamA family transporter n=1 Tax=Colwellia sp. PAMC 20917 TaxID=1816218 RepID=UPI0022B243BD|nr:EamA family transporter [Colwellia sp. PAMC 20917]